MRRSSRHGRELMKAAENKKICWTYMCWKRLIYVIDGTAARITKTKTTKHHMFCFDKNHTLFPMQSCDAFISTNSVDSLVRWRGVNSGRWTCHENQEIWEGVSHPKEIIEETFGKTNFFNGKKRERGNPCDFVVNITRLWGKNNAWSHLMTWHHNFSYYILLFSY